MFETILDIYADKISAHYLFAEHADLIDPFKTQGINAYIESGDYVTTPGREKLLGEFRAASMEYLNVRELDYYLCLEKEQADIQRKNDYQKHMYAGVLLEEAIEEFLGLRPKPNTLPGLRSSICLALIPYVPPQVS